MKEYALEFTCIWDVQAELGEGPVWDEITQSLYFVDVKRHLLFSYQFPEGIKKTWKAPDQISFVVLRKGGGLICGVGKTIYLFSPKQELFVPLLSVEDGHSTTRLNDACVDPKGRLWFGTMDDEEQQPFGCLYSVEFSGIKPSLRRHDQGYCISNGPVFDEACTQCWHTDSYAKTIYHFDIDKNGNPGQRRIFHQLDEAIPDGMAMDSANHVWVALYGGGGLYHYTSEGECVGYIPVADAPNITKPAFGGKDYQTLFITTARKGLSAEDRRTYPKAGGLFIANVASLQVRGVPHPAVEWPFETVC